VHCDVTIAQILKSEVEACLRMEILDACGNFEDRRKVFNWFITFLYSRVLMVVPCQYILNKNRFS
jgi:hypothetical protein